MAPTESLKISQPKDEQKSQKAAPVKTNDNGKPILNKNTIKQAEKPSKAPVTLPSAPGILPNMDDHDKLKKELEAKKAEAFDLQEQVNQLTTKLETVNSKNRAFAKQLTKLGIGTGQAA